jgi:hypothetical protein
LLIDGRKVSVADGADAGMLPERRAGCVDVGVAEDATIEGCAMREIDGVPIGQCHHIVRVQALPAEDGDELA